MRYHKLILSIFTISLAFALATANVRAAGIPQMIPYSGTIEVDGVKINGTGQFKFAIINGHTDCQSSPPGPNCIAYWTNDGSTSLDGSEPTNYVTIPVNNGNFSVKLGDTSLTNMLAVPGSSVFSNDVTYLRIWFDDGSTGSQLLRQDRQLVSIPYAYRAEVADAVTGSATVGSGQIADGAVTSAKIASGTIATGDLSFDPATQTELNTHKSNSDHDSQYYTQTQLNISDGDGPNSGSNRVNWNNLKDVPAGFADGADDNTTYTEGPGIDITGIGNAIGIKDNGVGSAQISDGSVSSGDVAFNYAGSSSKGGPATDVNCTGCIASTDILDSTVTGNDINTSTTLTASNFLYTSALSGVIYADPTSCQRALGSGDPDQDMEVLHPPGNSYGPSLRLSVSTVASGTYNWYCGVPIQIPPGATFTLTGATIAYYDGGQQCLVGADIRHKTFGTSGGGSVVSTVYDGSSSTDYTYTSAGPVTKAFPVFTQPITTSNIVFVRAFIINSGGGGDCRYTGVQINYTVDRP